MNSYTRDTIRIFWEHTKERIVWFWILVFVSVFATVFGLIPPLYYKKFFDFLSNSPPDSPQALATLSGYLFLILIFYALQWVFRRIYFFYYAVFQTDIMRLLSNSAFKRLQEHSYRFFSNRFVGALVRKAGRFVDSFEGITDRLFIDFLPLLVRLIVILVVIFLNNAVLGYILLVWLLVFFGLNYIFVLYKLRYDFLRAEADSAVTGRLADVVTNQSNVKIFAAFDFEAKSFSGLTKKQAEITRRAWFLTGWLEAVQGFIAIILEIGIFYYGALLWQKGEFTIGDFVLIQAYVLTLFEFLWNFGRQMRRFYHNLANANEMTEIFVLPNEVADIKGAKTLQTKRAVVEIKDLHFHYYEKEAVFENFNLTINAGEKVAIVGSSGAGKSTFVALLLRYFDPHAGLIMIDGQNIAEVKQDSLRSKIAFVPQEPLLFHRTIYENINYGRLNALKGEVIKAAKLAHCHEFITKLPEAYETYVGERGVKLSGGERQRVAIARAILKNAPILILDEATSSLDSESEMYIQDALLKLMKGKTVIAIAHRLSTIMRMDRILVFENGQIIESGTHETLLNHSEGVYRKLWELQAGGFVA